MGIISLDICVITFSFFIAIIKFMAHNHPAVNSYAQFSIFMYNLQ